MEQTHSFLAFTVQRFLGCPWGRRRLACIGLSTMLFEQQARRLRTQGRIRREFEGMKQNRWLPGLAAKAGVIMLKEDLCPSVYYAGDDKHSMPKSSR